MGLAIVLLFLWVFAPAGASAAPVGGTVIIKRKLSKSKVTASSSTYQRGVAVDLPSAPVEATLVQKNRHFSPEVLAVPAGSQVSFPNQDPVFHNVFSLSKSNSFDLGNYPKDQTRVVKFPQPGLVFVNCHLHPNMSAAIVVTPNSVFARPGRDGSLQLPDVPPGVRFFIPLDEARAPMASR